MKKIHEKMMADMEKRKGELLSMGSSKGLVELTEMEAERGDSVDIAEAASEKELTLTMRLRSTEELKQIEEAIVKIHSGEYGVCESCEEQIESKRLKVRPYVKYCLDCQEDIEMMGGEPTSHNVENYENLD